MYDRQTGLGTDQHRAILFVDGRSGAGMTGASVAPADGKTAAAAMPLATSALLIGRGNLSTGAASYYWKGAIDDVRVFPGILDPSQIRRIISERRTG